MRRMVIACCLAAWAAAALAADAVKEPKAAKTAKAAKAAKVPLLEKLTCRTGPNDHQARLIVEVVKGRLMEFAYYTRFGTGVCSIHGRRGDAYTKWEDGTDGKVAVKLLTGNAHAEYKPGRVLIKFEDVERMPYCGMFGELNGSIEVMSKNKECGLEGVFDRMGEG